MVRQFVKELSNALPGEIGVLTVDQRQKAKRSSLADSALAWIAYLELAKRVFGDKNWRNAVAALGQPYTHKNGWSGPLLARDNPLWHELGIVVIDPKSGNTKLMANRHAQEQVTNEVVKIGTAALTKAVAA